MSIESARQQLEAAHRDLLRQWDRARSEWSDAKSDEFAARYLVQLRPQVSLALTACEELGALIRRALQDCSDREEGAG